MGCQDMSLSDQSGRREDEDDSNSERLFKVQRSQPLAAFPSSAVNYSECTAPDGLYPPSPPPHDLLVRIGLYCAVLRRFLQQRLMFTKSCRWASFLETMFWQTWRRWRHKIEFYVFAEKPLSVQLCFPQCEILTDSCWALIYN